MTETTGSRQLALEAADLASDLKASNIVLLDLGAISSVTDYFVICTGRSDVQVRAICDRIGEGLGSRGHRPLSVEGLDHGHWALMDYGSIVVHVFQRPTRRTYDLERLWTKAQLTRFDARTAAVTSDPANEEAESA